MPKDINLNDLLVNRNALLEADWDQLKSLKQEHPYSHLIAQLVAKKHYLETGHFFSAYYNDALQLQNNPGQSFISMNHWEESKSVIEETSNIKAAIKAEKNDIDKKKLAQKSYSETIPSPLETIKNKPSLGIKTDFTRWLLKKNEALAGEPGKEKDKNSRTSEIDVLLKDEIVSESLAGIYAKQGLIEEAIEMYEKLSLINPKKSAYFAGLIENLKKR